MFISKINTMTSLIYWQDTIKKMTIGFVCLGRTTWDTLGWKCFGMMMKWARDILTWMKLQIWFGNTLRNFIKMAKKVKVSDRVGTTIGYLNILDWKRENNRSYFFVECELCRSRKWMRSDGIINGRNQSCGCLREKTQFQQDNLSGKKFGRLTAIKSTERRSENGSVIWNCECECGGHKDISASDLVGGRVKSCGCIRDELQTKLGNNLASITKEYSVEGTNVRNLTMRTRKDNTSGHTGVSWNRDKWKSQIKFKVDMKTNQTLSKQGNQQKRLFLEISLNGSPKNIQSNGKI